MAADPRAPARMIRPEPLSGEAFAPFGEVVEHAGPQRRRHLSVPFERGQGALQPRMWVSRIDEAVPEAGLRLAKLERHRRSAQTFIPLTNAGYLVAVAPSLGDGSPDHDGIRVFLASGSQGVSYRPDTWHHPLCVLRAPAEFVVMMTLGDDGADEEWREVPGNIRVVLPQGIHPEQGAP